LSINVAAGDRSAGIGQHLQTEGRPVVVQAEVSGMPSGMVSFHTDRGAVHQSALPSDGASSIEWRTTAEETSFVRIEVHGPGQDMAALTNPVILS
jgi:hypothetical protein